MAFREEEITVKRKITIYICDVCGKEEKLRKYEVTCEICRKDICSECTHAEYPNGDYCHGIYYCHRCWSVGEKYRKQIEEESDKHEKLIEDIHKRWKEECVNYEKVS